MTVQPGPGAYLYVVRCRLRDESRERDWNEWYDSVHVPAMLQVPGILGVRRFKALDDQLSYLALYDLESTEVFDHPRYLAARGWGEWETYVAEWSREIVARSGDQSEQGLQT